MKLSTMNSNGQMSEKRLDVESASGNPSRQASDADNSPVMMNKPDLAQRGSRADALIEMAGDDSYRLGQEPARKGKIKG